MIAPRRGWAALLVAMVLPFLAVVGAHSAVAGSQVDPRLTHAQCDLTGRVWLDGAGCERHECVAGATIFKEGHNAELCERRGKNGAEYAKPIDSRICMALHRVWLGVINSCASNPRRNVQTIPDDPACTGHHTTYVTHSEAEGHYDECLTPSQVRKLRKLARKHHSGFGLEALNHSRVLCSTRAAHVFVNGVCQVRVGPVPDSQRGGLLMVGDSVMWRAENELAARHPDWYLDGIPGRKIGDTGPRLNHFRLDHDQPTYFIVQLGQNATPQYTRSDFQRVLDSLTPGTPVMLIEPYRAAQSEDQDAVKATVRYARWMRVIGAQRPETCVADWPAVAKAHPGNLVDGEHPDDTHEVWYAKWVSRSWNSCRVALGLP